MRHIVVTIITITALLGCISVGKSPPPTPPTDTICQLRPIILLNSEWDFLSDGSIRQVIKINEQICAACPDLSDCQPSE